MNGAACESEVKGALVPTRVCDHCRPLWSARPVPGAASERLTRTLSGRPSSLSPLPFHTRSLLSAVECLSGIGFQRLCLSVDAFVVKVIHV